MALNLGPFQASLNLLIAIPLKGFPSALRPCLREHISDLLHISYSLEISLANKINNMYNNFY